MRAVPLSFCNHSFTKANISPLSLLQEAVDATVEVVKTLHEKVSMHAQIILDSCAYAGTGNVLKVQRLLSICGDHLEEDKTPGGVAHQVRSTFYLMKHSSGCQFPADSCLLWARSSFKSAPRLP